MQEYRSTKFNGVLTMINDIGEFLHDGVWTMPTDIRLRGFPFDGRLNRHGFLNLLIYAFFRQELWIQSGGKSYRPRTEAEGVEYARGFWAGMSDDTIRFSFISEEDEEEEDWRDEEEE